jgi:transglutaminase-like putative cysteine protease
VPVSVVRTFRPRGDAGAKQTLATLARMVRAGAVTPAIVSIARAIIQPAARGDVGGQIRLIRQWVGERTKWQPDPHGEEYLVPPAVMLARIAQGRAAPGDCDDVAALAGALLKAAGIPTRLTAIAFAPSRVYRHVFAEASPGPGRWVDLDTTRPPNAAARPARGLTVRV